jgi:hypothetical protein
MAGGNLCLGKKRAMRNLKNFLVETSKWNRKTQWARWKALSICTYGVWCTIEHLLLCVSRIIIVWDFVFKRGQSLQIAGSSKGLSLLYKARIMSDVTSCQRRLEGREEEVEQENI